MEAVADGLETAVGARQICCCEPMMAYAMDEAGKGVCASRSKRYKLLLTILVTLASVLDLATDWLTTGVTIVKYRALSPAEALGKAASTNKTLLGDKYERCTLVTDLEMWKYNEDVQKRLNAGVESRRVYMTNFSNVQIGFTALATIIFVVNLVIHWSSFHKVLNKKIDDMSDGLIQVSAKSALCSERMFTAFNTSPYLTDPLIILASFLTIVLEDFPQAVFNTILITATCDNVNIYILTSTIGSSVSALGTLWNYGLHFAYTMKWINRAFGMSNYVYRFDDKDPNHRKDKWNYCQKAIVYPPLVFISVVIILLRTIAGIFMVALTIIVACPACYHSYKTDIAETSRKSYEEPEEQDCGCCYHTAKLTCAMFSERPSDFITGVVVLMSFVVLVVNICIVLFWFEKLTPMELDVVFK